jgi:hypothetical protein
VKSSKNSKKVRQRKKGGGNGRRGERATLFFGFRVTAKKKNLQFQLLGAAQMTEAPDLQSDKRVTQVPHSVFNRTTPHPAQVHAP